MVGPESLFATRSGVSSSSLLNLGSCRRIPGFRSRFDIGPTRDRRPSSERVPSRSSKVSVVSTAAPLDHGRATGLVTANGASPLPLSRVTSTVSSAKFVMRNHCSLRARDKVNAETKLARRRGGLFSCFMPMHNVDRRLMSMLRRSGGYAGHGKASEAKGLLVVKGGKGNGAILTISIMGTVRGRHSVHRNGITVIANRSLGGGEVKSVFHGLCNNTLVVRGTKRVGRGALTGLGGTVRRSAKRLLMILRRREGPLSELLSSGERFEEGFASELRIPVFVGSRLMAFKRACTRRGNCEVSRVKVLTLCDGVSSLRERSRTMAMTRIGRIVSSTVTRSRGTSTGGLIGEMFKGGASSSSEVLLSRGSFGVW